MAGSTGRVWYITFVGPGRALRCARMIVETVRDLDLKVRIGAISEKSTSMAVT
jgi:hypothetical protein